MTVAVAPKALAIQRWGKQGVPRLCIAVLSGLLPASHVFAQGRSQSAPISDGCFSRVYEEAHLARHLNQQTTAMRLSLRNEIIPGSVGVPPQPFIRLEVSRRDKRGVLRAIGTCMASADANRTTAGTPLVASHPRADGIVCSITGENLDAEGGFLVLALGGHEARVHLNDDLTMRQASTVSAHPGQYIKYGSADRVFRLDKVQGTECKDLNKAIRFE